MRNRSAFHALAVVIVSAAVAAAQTKYPTASPLSQYFIPDKASEIALARSAAPASISAGAEVLVMAHDGYTTAVKGGNGFTCLVERGFAAATDDPVFWNPKIRGPICVNAPAANTYLPTVLMKATLALAGKSREEIADAVKSALATGKLPALAPNAMSYMMSKQQYLSDDAVHWHPHMMWFVPGDSIQSWGAKGEDVPVYVTNVPGDRMTIFMVPVSQWSDGTPAMH